MASRFTRRAVLQGAAAGAGLGAAHALTAFVPGARPPASGGAGRSAQELLRALGASLTDRQRELIVFPADHPTRQIANTISVIDRPHLGTLLSPGQTALARELTDSLLSPRGRADFAGTLAVEGRFEGCVLAVYGEPTAPGAQVVLQGGHLMLRSRARGTGFGGGVAYGHQVGNLRWRVEGNAFAWHGDAANRLFAALSPAERRAAVLPEPPHELVLQPQGRGATLPGVGFGGLGEAARQAAADLLEAVFASFPRDARAEARACIDAGGGLDALHFATYESRGFYADMVSRAELDAAERARRGDPYWQVWRIEGPGAVVFFKGYPHVHAYVNVVREPERANLGETLAEIPHTLEGPRLRRVLDGALRRATGEPLAWHGPEVPGRFCRGPVTTGLAYALDPYGNEVTVATLDGRGVAPPLRAHLASEGVALRPDRRYRVATIAYLSRERPDLIGEPAEVERTGVLLRDALVAHLRAGAAELGAA